MGSACPVRDDSALFALETGKNVSGQKIERYLQMLGYRTVIVPKSASVEVSE